MGGKPTEIEQVQIDELHEMSKRVSNGEAPNVKLQGKVIGRLGMLFCIYARKGFMTVDDCAYLNGSVCGADVPAPEAKHIPKLKLGPVELSGYKLHDIGRVIGMLMLVWVILSQLGLVPNARTDGLATIAAVQEMLDLKKAEK
jgi:hypothetical protein